MSTVLESPLLAVSSPDDVRLTLRTLEDLVNELGGIPLSRVRVSPPIGSASESDLLTPQGSLCELVSGAILEKGMGFFESRLATLLTHCFENWLANHKEGFVIGDGALTRLQDGLVRIPDVSFYRWDRIGEKSVPRDPICRTVPNLAVEIVSRTNTRAEMDRKRQEYFEAGVELVWIVYPDTMTVEVWSTARDCHISGHEDTLTGGTLLPGFQLSISEWFQRAQGGPA